MRVSAADGWSVAVLTHPMQQLKPLCVARFAACRLAVASLHRAPLAGAAKVDWPIMRASMKLLDP
eukprot:13211043-Alexandrium_andersonii.AAC.1